MAVTAKFVPEQIELLPNTPATLTLRLYNDDAETRTVTLAASGDLSDYVRLDSSTATVDTNQIVDVSVSVFVPSTVVAGTYTISADVAIVQDSLDGEATDSEATDSAATDGEAAHDQPGVEAATATAVVLAHSDYTIALQPARSHGATAGRHIVRLANTGNVVVTVELSANATDDDVTVQLGDTSMTVEPGLTGLVSLRVEPSATYWSGPAHDHHFTLDTTSVEGRSDELTGTFQQRPRLPNWVGPAAAGAGTALLLGMIAWFALLRPWVQDTADDAAAHAIEQDRAALRDRIDELEAAAAEAEELPLGTPIDIRLSVAPTAGSSEQDAVDVEAGTTISITDVVWQNPTGAVGTASLRRGEEILLQSELANFRDYDLHFVAPLQFDDDTQLVLDVECRTPGAGTSDCPVAVSLVGFVDETD